MTSDSLNKPRRYLHPVQTFKMYRARSMVYLQPLKHTWKPWIVIPAILMTCLNIFWLLIVDTADLIWTDFLPSGFKNYLEQRNWAHIGFKAFSGLLLSFYALVAIALWYGSPWGPGGQTPELPAKDIMFLKHNIQK